MTTDLNDFDGCARKCRQAGAHTLVWGECEHAPEPEPTVSLSRVYTDTDGLRSIGFDSYTVEQLADLIEPVLRTVHARLGPNALAMLNRGETVSLSGGEYADLAREAAHAIVHRHDGPVPVAVSVPPPTRADDAALVDLAAQAIRDSNGSPEALEWWRTHPQLIPAHVYAAAVLAVLPPPADRAAVLREAADEIVRIDAHPNAMISAAAAYAGIAARLRRMADEQQQPVEAWDVPDARPGTTDHTLVRRMANEEQPTETQTGADYARALTTPPGADAVTLLREAATLYDARDQPESAALLRRLARELTPAGRPVVGEQPDTHTPHRGDPVETWLKTLRDEWAPAGCQPWQVLDQALDAYRLHADTGTPLSEHVCEGRAVGGCETPS